MRPLSSRSCAILLLIARSSAFSLAHSRGLSPFGTNAACSSLASALIFVGKPSNLLSRTCPRSAFPGLARLSAANNLGCSSSPPSPHLGPFLSQSPRSTPLVAWTAQAPTPAPKTRFAVLYRRAVLILATMAIGPRFVQQVSTNHYCPRRGRPTFPESHGYPPGLVSIPRAGPRPKKSSTKPGPVQSPVDLLVWPEAPQTCFLEWSPIAAGSRSPSFRTLFLRGFRPDEKINRVIGRGQA